MSTWAFLRHGQSEANAAGWLAGFVDSPLTALGAQEAEAARAAIDALPLDLVLTSDLGRALRTAEIVLQDRAVPRVVSPGLRERHGGSFEGQLVERLRASGELARLSEWDGRPPGGESLADVAERSLRTLAHHEGPQCVLVVAHGALIRAVLHAVDFAGVGPVGEFRPRNCELVTRELPVGTWNELLRQLFPHS